MWQTQRTSRFLVPPEDPRRSPLKRVWGWAKDNAPLLAVLATLVGAILALGGVFIQQLGQRELERERMGAQLTLEDRRTQEAQLQSYLDDMGGMLLDEKRPLRKAKPGDDLSNLAQARTSSIFQRLDEDSTDQKEIVLRFLYDSRLITSERKSEAPDDGTPPLLDLEGIDLNGIDLNGANFGDDTDGFIYSIRLHRPLMSRADLRACFARFTLLSLGA